MPPDMCHAGIQQDSGSETMLADSLVRRVAIPPATQLAIQSDPDLAKAKAIASQDRDLHGSNLIDRILILILAKANSRWIDQKSTGSEGFASFHAHPHPPKA